MNDIESAEYKNGYPVRKLYLNDPNKEDNFNINFVGKKLNVKKNHIFQKVKFFLRICNFSVFF